MSKHGPIELFSENNFVRSRLTGTMIARNSEAFRHEREIEFLCSLSPDGLDDILNGFGGKICPHESLTAVLGQVEVDVLRSEIARFRAFSVT